MRQHNWLTKDHEDFNWIAMNKKFPKNERFDTVRTTTSANIDRMQRCTQDLNTSKTENTFRWEQSSKQTLTGMKVHVFSDSTLCVGVSNPDPSFDWVAKLERTRNCRIIELARPRIAIHLARSTRCVHP